MKKLLFTGLVVLAAAWVVPARSVAKEGLQGTITLGGAGVKLNDSYKYAEYDGIPEDGFYVIGAADLNYNRGSYFLDFQAEDLGLDNRELRIESGRYGKYKMFLGFNQFIKRESNASKTPFNGAGGGTLTLPTGFVEGANTTDMTTLAASLKGINLQQKRKRANTGLSYTLGSATELNVSFQREYKKGTKSLGGVVGFHGGQGASTILPQPVDYVTDELNASFSYNGERSNVQLGYFLSLFNNQEETLTWQAPFDVSLGPVYQSPLPSNGFSAMHVLPPDNEHHRFSLSGGVNFPKNTRVSAIAELGKMEQNETLVPYSTSTTTALLPRTTAEAEIDTTRLGLKVSSRPIRKLALAGGYTYYRTENKTPRELFRYVKTDNINGTQAAVDSDYALYSLPYDYTQNKIDLDASYYVFRATSLKLGYDIETMDRDYREIKKTKENTYSTRLRSGYFSKVQANLDFSYSERKADDKYNPSLVYDAHFSEDFIATQATDARFRNNADMRKYDIADRNRTKYGANVTTFPHYTTSVALFYSVRGDDYKNSTLGIQDQDIQSYTVDVAFSPIDIVSMSLYYTRDDNEWKQVGRSFVSFPDVAVEAADTDSNWSANHEDINETIGLSFILNLMEDRLQISSNFTYSKSNTAISFGAGPNLTPPTNLPDLKTELHSVDLTGKYRLTEKFLVGLGYEYERYTSDDWQTDGVAPGSTTLADVITLFGSTANYEAHLAMFFVTMEL